MSITLGEHERHWRLQVQLYIMANVWRPLMWTGSVKLERMPAELNRPKLSVPAGTKPNAETSQGLAPSDNPK